MSLFLMNYYFVYAMLSIYRVQLIGLVRSYEYDSPSHLNNTYRTSCCWVCVEVG